MTAVQRRYIAVEAMIGATISAAISIAFVLLMFGGRERVPVGGTGGLIVDALPQGFFVGLMATLVPTLLTRRRMRRGTVGPLAAVPTRWPATLLLRALLIAVLVAVAGAALTALLLAGRASLPLSTVLVAKASWGLLLGGVVAMAMTRVALTARAGA